jgi:hypothetical protein
MTEKQCQKEYDEWVKAMIEWVEASDACREFVSTKPISPHEDLQPLSPEDTERFIHAYDRKDIAHKKFLEANKAYFECKQKYS